MFDRAKVVRITPDSPGKGGYKSSYHTHPVGAHLDTRTADGVFPWFGRWRKENQSKDYVGITGAITTAADQSLSLHSFSKFDTTDPTKVATTYLLHQVKQGATYNIYNIGGLVPPTVYPARSKAVPASYMNINNRCFMVDGGGEGQIWDGTTTAYAIGITQPVNAPGYVVDRSQTTTVTNVHIADQGAYLSLHDTSTPSLSLIKAGTALTISGQSGYKATTAGVLQTTFANPGGLTGPALATVYTCNGLWPANNQHVGLLVRSGAGSSYVVSYTRDEVAETTTITLAATLSGGAPLVGATYTVEGQQVAITPNWVDVAGTAYQITYQSGELNWTGAGPRYAYAYYDSETGHVSNISPITATTEQDEKGVRIRLSGFSFLAAGNRFDKIIFFRTLLNGGSVMFLVGDPLDATEGKYWIKSDGTGIDPYTPLTPPPAGVNVGTWTDKNPDSSLTLTLRGPQFTNYPPLKADGITVGTPVHGAYWDGRVWLSMLDQPGAVIYSGDSIQIPFGVAAECYPQTNRLQIPAQDGRVCGMKLIGNLLVITTERFAYYVAGNTESNYRLLRFATSMNGVGTYQMAELPGESEQEQSGVVYIGRDKKVYVYTPGGGNTYISGGIQDVLSAAITNRTTYLTCRVHVANISGRKVIIVRVPGQVFHYDTVQKAWFGSNGAYFTTDVAAGAPETFCSIYATETPVIEATGKLENCVGWLDSSALYVNASSVGTFPMDFDGNKHFKQINFVRLYVSRYTANKPWSVKITVNDGSYVTLTPLPYTDPAYDLFQPSDGATLPVDGSAATQVIAFPSGGSRTAAGGATTIPGPLQGYRFKVDVTFPADYLAADLYAIDVCYSEVGAPQLVSL